MEEIFREIEKIHHSQTPILGILTQCDELDPPDIRSLPTDDEEKNNNSGRKLSLEAVSDFLATVGVGVGADAGLRAIATGLVKLLPVAGQIISGVAAATATTGIGQATIAFFIEQSPTEAAKKKLGW